MKIIARFLVTLCLLQSSLYAQSVSSAMNYQGKLTDAAGAGIGTGTPVNRKVRFRIYDSASSATNILWGEQQTVTISNGEFSVLLGQGDVFTLSGTTDPHGTLESVMNTNSTGSSPSSDRYMEVTVDDGGGTIDASDTPISPRQQITSTAFAFRAKTAESIGASNSLQLGSATSSGLGYYSSNRTFNSYSIDGPVLYGNGGGALGSYSGSTTQKTALLWNAAGQVGIGTPVLTSANSSNKTMMVIQGDDSATPAQQLVIRGNTDTNERLNVGFDTTLNQASLQSYTAVSTTGSLLLNPSGGNVGIGVSAPGFPLNFANVLGDKISLWGSTAASSHFGFGIQNGLLQIHSDSSSADIAFGYGQSSSMTETMRIKGSGYVGIGNSSPLGLLTVNSGNPAITLGTSDVATGAWIRNDGTNMVFSSNVGDMYFGYSGNAKSLHFMGGGTTDVMTINSSGNVGVGTTSPSKKLHVAADVQFDGGINLGSVATGGRGIGGTMATSDSWQIFGWSGDGNNNGSLYIETYDDATEPIIFRQSGNERMRISANARIDIGTTDEAAGGHLVVGNQGMSIAGNSQRSGVSSYGNFNVANGGIQFGIYNSSQNAGWRYFTYDGDSNIDYQSDVRLKKDIVDVEPMLDRMLQVKFRRFHWKNSTPDDKMEFGVIAQELEPLFPDMVKDGQPNPGETEGYKMVGYDNFGRIACKSIQEFKSRNDADLSKLQTLIEQKNTQISSLEDQNKALQSQLEKQSKQLIALEGREQERDAKIAEITKRLLGGDSAPQTVSIKADQ